MSDTPAPDSAPVGKWRLFDDESRHVDRFGFLLAVVLVLVVTLLLVDIDELYVEAGAGWTSIGVTLLVGVTLLLAMRASGVSRRWMRIADVLVGLSVIATVLLVFAGAGTDATDVPPPYTWTALAVIAPVFIVRRMLLHGRASAKTLMAAVSAYLLIAVAFAFIYLTVDAHTMFFANDEPSTSFVYYSFVTLTTLGFGDLVATTAVGRMLTTVEAIIGQVYLVVIVSMVVGLLVAERQAKREAERRGENPT